MITLNKWMELIDYRVTEGSNYFCDRYGQNAFSLDSWNGEQDGYSFSIIFDTCTQTVYEVQAHDYAHNRAYRMIAESYKPKSSEDSVAWDDVNYVDLELDEDFIQKCLAIKIGENYDTRVTVPVDIPNDELFKFMLAAHERDMTLNQFVEQTLRNSLEEIKRDSEEVKSSAQQYSSSSELHGY